MYIYIKNKDKNEVLKKFIKESIVDIITGIVYLGIVGYFTANTIYVMSSGKIFNIQSMLGLMKIAFILGNLALAIIGFIRAGKIKNSSKYYGTIIGMVLMAVVLGVELINAQNSILSILCSVLLTAGAFLTIFDLIRYHNELTTRKPSHLSKRGGDVIANNLDM